MFFWNLLFAHVVGDFPLQTDTVYKWKASYKWGILPHITICTVLNVLLLFPFLNNGHTWIAIIFLSIIHALLDRGKILISQKTSKDTFFLFLFDQVFHVISIAIAAIWLSKNIDMNSYNVGDFFSNREIINQMTALVVASFAGVPTLYYVQKFWADIKKEKISHEYPSLLKRVPGYFERLLATLGIIWGGWWYFMAVIVFIPRLLLNWRDEDRYLLVVYSLSSLVFCTLCALYALLAA